MLKVKRICLCFCTRLAMHFVVSVVAIHAQILHLERLWLVCSMQGDSTALAELKVV